MEPGSLNTPILSSMSSQESTSFAGWDDANFRLDADGDISELLNQLYDMAQVRIKFLIILFYITYISNRRRQLLLLLLLRTPASVPAASSPASTDPQNRPC